MDINQDYSYSKEYELLYNELRKSKFIVNLSKDEFMTELSDGQSEFKRYRNWNKLIKKIASI